MTNRRMVVLLAALSLSVSLFAQSRRERRADEWLVATGHISIHKVASNGLLITFDPEKDTARHHIFQFATKQGMPALKVENREGSVDYRGNELAIMTSDDEMYIFALSDDPNRKLPAGLSSGVTIIGVALNHQIRSTDTKKDLSFYDTESAGDSNSCQAGGDGASSCSIGDRSGSCSAACVTGYVACCKQQSCKCIKY